MILVRLESKAGDCLRCRWNNVTRYFGIIALCNRCFDAQNRLNTSSRNVLLRFTGVVVSREVELDPLKSIGNPGSNLLSMVTSFDILDESST